MLGQFSSSRRAGSRWRRSSLRSPARRTCSSAPSTRESAQAASCSPTGEIDPDLPLDETIGAWVEPSGTRSATDTAASGEWSGDGALAEGDLVFAFHPHQDRFVVPTDDVIALRHRPARGDAAASRRDCVATVTRRRTRRGEQVVVVGLGVVGLLTAALLVRGGARVVASEPLEWRRTPRCRSLSPPLHRTTWTPRFRHRTGRTWSQGRDRGERQPGRTRAELAAAGARGNGAGRILVRHEAGAAALGRGVPPPAADDPVQPGVHHPGRSAAGLDGRQSVGKPPDALLDELPLDRSRTHTFAFDDAAEAFAAVDRSTDGLIHAALCY